jgi:hypothetical protein
LHLLQIRSSEKDLHDDWNLPAVCDSTKTDQGESHMQLFIEAGEEHLTVRAYEDVLTAIVQPDEKSHVRISLPHVRST